MFRVLTNTIPLLPTMYNNTNANSASKKNIEKKT